MMIVGSMVRNSGMLISYGNGLFYVLFCIRWLKIMMVKLWVNVIFSLFRLC